MLLAIISPPVLAHPLLPLPPFPVLAPGTPAPPYCVPHSNHPLIVLALSIVVPGAAIQTPLTPVPLVILILKLATTDLRNAIVIYCVPVSALLFGPTGR